MRAVAIALALVACVVASSWAANQPAEAHVAATSSDAARPATRWLAPDLGIDAFVFGVPADGSEEEEGVPPQLVERTRVPNVDGQGYGWQLFFRTGRDRMRVREVLTLPAPPVTWGDAEKSVDATLSADRRTLVVEQDIPARHSVTRWWSVTSGDPSGRYEVRVYLDGVLAGEATFFVEEAR